MSRRTDPMDRIDHLVYTGRITEDEGNILRRLRSELRASRKRRRGDRLLVLWLVFCLGAGAVAWALYVAAAYR